jgi:stearoyl-CoA desaturase (delta-9 desaturase)
VRQRESIMTAPSTAPAAAPSVRIAPDARRRYVLPRRRRFRAQTLHATSIVVLPAVAVVLAALDVRSGRVHAWLPTLALTLFALTMMGVTVGFHRLLSHRAFQTTEAVRVALAILGSMAAQGPVIYWVSNHRRHHRFSDAAGDPHSPHRADERALGGWRGFWHAHVGWTFTHDLTNSAYVASDLLQDRRLAWVNRHYGLWVMTGLVAPALVGALIAGAPGAWRGLLWGGGVRLFLSYHFTSSINSITHVFGYRSYSTPEQSRNNLWLSLPTFGEAWHNNHHAAPSSAIFGLAWWEIDLGGLAIRVLERCGLAWHVHRMRPGTAMRARAARSDA